MLKLLEALKPGDRDRELALSLDPARIPAHIAIIMDGNGRWAKRRGLPRVAGHKVGVSTVRNIVEDCSDMGVKALTLYAFSAENWKRPRTEIDVLWRLLKFYLRHDLEDLQKNNIRLESIGRVEALPDRVYEELRATERATARNTGMRLTLAINYSARVELTDAINSILDEARLAGRLADLTVDEKMISRRLYTAGLPEPDLLIRTSGEMRVSNFLLWQIAYAELYVTETLWPDFNRAELLRAMQDFQRRERRFGGLSEPEPVETDASENEASDEPEFEEIAVSSKMKRVVTALFLVPIAVYAALFAPWWFFLAIVGIVAVLCFREYAEMTGAFAPIGYIAGILILLAPQRETILLMILTALAALCLPLYSGEDFRESVPKAAAVVLGVTYIFGSWKTAILLHDSMDRPAWLGATAGHHWMMFGLMVNWIGDTGAYYVGKNFGKRRLAPRVSPGKTWEGAAASAVTGVIFGLLYLPFAIPGTPLWIAGSLALATNVAGQVGDLAESAIKRGVGVKDSGSLLPGHGGFLDRVDSTMFALPVLYTLQSFLH